MRLKCKWLKTYYEKVLNKKRIVHIKHIYI
jgi:hypothetical protein